MIDEVNMTTVREIKDKLNEQFARIGHALSSPKRLELLELLHQCEKSVETLVANSGMSIANTSRHLQVLRGAGLVETRRDGIYIFYRLADDQVYDLVSNMKRVAESRLAELERVLANLADDPGEVEVMDRNKLMKLAKAGKIIVLDVRPEDEYLAGHLPHAISIPLDRLKSHLNKLPQDQQIVAYCRGPYCVLSGEAVRVLRSKGFEATRLGDGVAEWKAAGMPVSLGRR
jgi:rhodanese-related sulfurtransferase/DNA-binding transcriptional ArsR family regulator